MSGSAGSRDAPFEARVSRWRVFLLVLLSLGFVALGLWFVGALNLAPPSGDEVRIVGWASILVFGFFAAAGLWRMRSSGVVLRVDGDGVWIGKDAARPIPWSEVGEIAVVTVSRQKMLGLAPYAGGEDTTGAWQGLKADMNRATVEYPVCISTTGTDRRFQDLLTAVRHHSAAASARNR